MLWHVEDFQHRSPQNLPERFVLGPIGTASYFALVHRTTQDALESPPPKAESRI